MPSNDNTYKLCPKAWITDTRVYKCFTCDSTHRLIICKKCFINGKHDGHDYQLITSLNGYCNCGHSSGNIYCTAHPKTSSNSIQNNLCFNDIGVNELCLISGIDENESKYLIGLNQIRKILSHSSVWTLIEDYFEKSQAIGQKPVRIRNIFSVYREDQENTFIDCGFDKQKRLLLWHGTKSKNLSGILNIGFKLPTNEKLMFGKGIYFADRVTKSCDYCDPNGSGVLLLCEVSVGSMYRTGTPKPYTCAPDNHNSIKGIGKLIPKPNEEKVFNKSIEVPIGQTVDNSDVYSRIPVNSELNFNEYIVFEPKRILIKFILQFDWS